MGDQSPIEGMTNVVQIEQAMPGDDLRSVGSFQFFIFFEKNDGSEEYVCFGAEAPRGGEGCGRTDPHRLALNLWDHIGFEGYMFHSMLAGPRQWKIVTKSQFSRYMQRVIGGAS